MSLGSVPCVDIHAHRVKLLEGVHRLEQDDNDPTPFDGLNGSGKQVGCQGFKVLKHCHPKGVAQNLVGVFVVAVPGSVRSFEYCCK